MAMRPGRATEPLSMYVRRLGRRRLLGWRRREVDFVARGVVALEVALASEREERRTVAPGPPTPPKPAHHKPVA